MENLVRNNPLQSTNRCSKILHAARRNRFSVNLANVNIHFHFSFPFLMKHYKRQSLSTVFHVINSRVMYKLPLENIIFVIASQLHRANSRVKKTYENRSFSVLMRYRPTRAWNGYQMPMTLHEDRGTSRR